MQRRRRGVLLEGSERDELLSKLQDRYENPSRSRWVMVRKRYTWMVAVHSAYILKRIVDILVAAGVLILLAPVMLLVAAGIKLYDGGPVLYSGKRVGRWGELFPFPKFRSMVVDAHKGWDSLKGESDHDDSVTFKMKRDPRVTPLGRWIRRLSIDELPQLWCVLKGDMSLVGPRPPLPEEVAEYSLEERRRLDVKPGITCFWQVEGRAEIPFEGQLALDLEYIESQSLWTDIKIILKTVPAVLLGKGAY